jgi:hypothetical protein
MWIITQLRKTLLGDTDEGYEIDETGWRSAHTRHKFWHGFGHGTTGSTYTEGSAQANSSD